MSGHVVIGSAQEFAEYANSVIKNIEVLYVPEEQMEVSNVQNDDPPKIPGTLQVRHIERQITDDQAVLSFYQVSPQSGDVIPCFREESYPVKATSKCSQGHTSADAAVQSSSVEQSNSAEQCTDDQRTVAKLDIISGQWYAAYCSEYNYWFVGHAISVQEKSVELDFIEQKGIGVNAFNHNEKDVKTIPRATVFHKLEEAPEPLSTFRYDTLCLSDQDFSMIQKIFMEKYHL